MLLSLSSGHPKPMVLVPNLQPNLRGSCPELYATMKNDELLHMRLITWYERESSYASDVV